MVKSLRMEKIRRIGKSLRALKSPRLVKYWRSWKSRRPAYCLGSAESPNADFSLVPLMSTSLLMWWISHVVSKWEEGSGCPAFMGGPSPVLYWLFVPARHAKKWPKSTRQPKVWLLSGIPLISVKSQQFLTQLISVLSLRRKNVHDHCCCPISAIILTTSKLEAILKDYRDSLKTVQWGRIIWGGGGGGRFSWYLSTCPGCRCVGSLGLHTWWHLFYLLFRCLFLLLHLSLYRGKLGGSW